MLKLLIVSVASLSLLACQPAPDRPAAIDRSPAFAGITTEPPLNRPVSSMPPKAEPGAPIPAKEPALPGVLVTANGVPFFGDTQMEGPLIVTQTAARFADRDFTVRYRTPDASLAPRPFEGRGTVRLFERSGPTGVERLIAVQSEKRLHFALIEQRSAKPVMAPLTEALSVRQIDRYPPDNALPDTPAEPEASPYHLTPVWLYVGNEPLEQLPIGKLARVKTPEGVLHVLVILSHFHSPRAEDRGEYPAAYILEFWATAG